MGYYVAPVPAVALELLDNLNYDGDRDGTCSSAARIRFGCRAFHPRRFAFRKRALACAVMAPIARRKMADASCSNSSGSTWVSGLSQSQGWDRGASKELNVHRSCRWRPGTSTSLWIRGCGRAFRPLPADSETAHSVEMRLKKSPQDWVIGSGCTARPLLLGRCSDRKDSVRCRDGLYPDQNLSIQLPIRSNHTGGQCAPNSSTAIAHRGNSWERNAKPFSNACSATVRLDVVVPVLSWSHGKYSFRILAIVCISNTASASVWIGFFILPSRSL